ncbi:TRAP transporter small permease [Vannielia litorea]|uniref:TRAP transporter small permease protein n=1 Tax=Vannielia litorea TaxID=1217970 RepID=A0A1N6IG89_9RHOB|nr:TRAP transporter small permease subunit [Vannielia litorea]SIO31046.1 TRAP-type C4-dicarboxylate transport system, small permease component [Vannielia litorea]
MHEQSREEAQPAFSRLPLFPDRIVTGLVRLCGAVSTLLILYIFGQICVAVVRRYVFDAPLQWNDQMAGYLLVAVVMLGAAEALRRGDHIGIDLLASRLSPARARVQAAVANLAVMGFAAVVGLSIWESIAFARRFGSYSIGYIEVQTWIPQVPVVLGAGLLFLAAALRLWRTLRPLP